MNTHFSGNWQESERIVLQEAARRVGGSWNFTVYPSVKGVLYTAVQFGQPRMLNAREVNELAQRVQTLPPETPTA